MVELICKVSDFSTEDDAVLKFNDEIAQEIVGLVEEFKQFNSNYWEQVEYTTFGSRNKPKRVILFPNAPFTGDGEEVIWQNVKTNKEKTISGIDVITNCRVMQYDYVEQTGVVAMLDNVQDVVPQNVYMSSNRKPIGFYPPSLPPPDFNTIMNVKLLGDLTIYVQNTSAIVFTGVTDPAHLAIMIKTLKNKQNQAVLRSNVLKKSLPADQIADTNPKVSELNCSKCGNAHIPSNSKFCNLCGSALSPICTNCSYLNPSGSAFCSKCGSKIVQ